MSSTVAIILTVLAIAGITAGTYLKLKFTKPDVKRRSSLTMNQLLEIVKNRMVELVKEDSPFNLMDPEYKSRRDRINVALSRCTYGVDSAKTVVKALIKSILIDVLPTDEDILTVYNFRSRNISRHVKMEALLQYYKSYAPVTKGKDSLSYLIRKYGWNKPKYVKEDGTQPCFVVTDEDLAFAYNAEKIEMTRDLMLDVLTTLIYQRYKGFGVIDTIREMNINGLNCGVSGSVLYNLGGGGIENMNIPKAPRSIWVQFDSMYIHFKCLSFGTEEELRRVTQLIIRWNNPGQLVEKTGYIVNTMYDKSRVLAMRPNMGEYWAFFLRKFSLSINTVEALLNPKIEVVNPDGTTTKKDKYKNTQLPIKLLEFLMRASVTTGFTGRQSSGKTTMMKAAIYFIDMCLNIRVLEMAPEMYLRELYPERNIYSAQETIWVNATDIQDAFKKSDAGVTIVGEVATSSIASNMIQLSMTATKFTIYSHHGISTEKMVYALRDDIVKAGGYNDLKIAEKAVVEAVRMDVHLDFDPYGRFCERFTEIVALNEYEEYPEIDESKVALSQVKILREYARRTTDRRSFKTVNIIEFDKHTREYKACEWLSDELTNYMWKELPQEKLAEFQQFAYDNWGVEIVKE